MGKKHAPPAGGDAGEEGPQQPVYLPDGVDCLAGEGKVRIYKFVKGEWELCATRERDTVARDIEQIARDFGGGKFRLETLTPNGDYEERHTIKFSESAFPPPSLAAVPPAQNGVDLAAVMGTLAAERQASQAAIEKANDRVMATIAETNRTFIALIAGMQGRPQPDAFANVERVVTLVSSMLAPLMGKQGGPDFDTIWSMIERGMEMGRRTDGGGGGIVDTIKDIMPMVKEVLMTRRASAPRPAVSPAPALPQIPQVTATSQAAPGPVSPGNNGTDPKVAAVKSSPFYPLYVPKLLEAMRHHSDVGETADEIFGRCPPAYLEQFEREVGAHDVADILAVYEPEVRGHVEWIHAVWDEVKALTAPEPEAAPEAAAVEPAPEPEPEGGGGPGGGPAESAE